MRWTLLVAAALLPWGSAGAQSQPLDSAAIASLKRVLRLPQTTADARQAGVPDSTIRVVLDQIRRRGVPAGRPGSARSRDRGREGRGTQGQLRGVRARFQGLYDAIVRDLSCYRFGDVLVTDEESFITKSDVFLVNWFERIPYVEAATPRVQSSAAINVTKNGKLIEEFRVPVIGVDPFRDPRVSTAHETVMMASKFFLETPWLLAPE